MGPKGLTVLLRDDNGTTVATKDGVTVSAAVYPDDPVERMGAELVRDAARKTAEQAGDGTSTCTVIAAAMCAQAERLITAGTSQAVLRRELPVACGRVAAALAELATPCTTFDDLTAVAMIASNGDASIAAPAAEAVHAAGQTGRITLEDVRSGATHLEVADGLLVNAELLSNHFANVAGKLAAASDEALVVVSRMRLQTFDRLMDAFKLAGERKCALVLLFSDYDQAAFQALVSNRQKAHINVFACKLHRVTHDEVADIAAAIGAEPFDPDGATNAVLGNVKRFYADRATVSMVPADATAAGAIASKLYAAADEAHHVRDRDALLARAASVAAKHCVVRVSAPTDAEATERKHRAEDAIAACRAAQAYGLIRGGGRALIDAVRRARLDDLTRETASIVLAGAEQPLRTIMLNAGRSYDWFASAAAAGDAYDANADTIVKSAPWLIDPLAVTKHAFENAASVCRTFVALSSVIHPC
jgi:chaperonin GroEL